MRLRTSATLLHSIFTHYSFSASGISMPSYTQWPSTSSFLVRKQLFSPFSFSPAFSIAIQTFSIISSISSNVSAQQMISSRQTMHYLYNMSDNDLFICLQKAAGAVLNPNGIRFHLYQPKGVIKVDSSVASSPIGNYQYPDLRSILAQYFLYGSSLSTLSTEGIGKPSPCTTPLTLRQSMHNRRTIFPHIFLFAMTHGCAHGELTSSIKSASNKACTSFCRNSRSSRE